MFHVEAFGLLYRAVNGLSLKLSCTKVDPGFGGRNAAPSDRGPVSGGSPLIRHAREGLPTNHNLTSHRFVFIKLLLSNQEPRPGLGSSLLPKLMFGMARDESRMDNGACVTAVETPSAKYLSSSVSRPLILNQKCDIARSHLSSMRSKENLG